MKLGSFTLMLAALVALFAPARAAELSLKDVFTGKVAPLTMTYKELTAEWKQFKLETKAEHFTRQGSSEYPNEIMQMYQAFECYYTTGEMVSFGGESYLLAYHRQNPIESAVRAELQRNMTGQGQPDDRAMFAAFITTPETPLNLCLLNLRTAGSLLDLRPVDPAQDQAATEAMLTQAQDKAYQTQSINNLRQLAVGMNMYLQDNDETFPAPQSSTDFSSIEQYTDAKVRVHPKTKETYHVNLNLSGMKIGEIERPSETPIIYEATPWPDGSRCVAFLDGHVEKLTSNRWDQMQQQWGLE